MAGKVGTKAAFNEINMTPLIDIVLVVLIIMMVNIPIQVNKLGVKLPSNEPPPADMPPDTEQLAIAVYADGQVALNRRVMVQNSAILLDKKAASVDKDKVLFGLFQEVSRRLRASSKKNVFIDAHPDVGYGIVVDMMDLAREAGAVNVGLAKMKPEGPLPPTSVESGALPRGVFPGSPSVVGYITEKKADEALQPLMATLRGCYEQGLATNPGITGRILVRIDVQYQGQLMEATVEQSSLQAPDVDMCVASAIQQLKFPPLEGSDDKPAAERTARIVYPLLFSPG
jgi:TonB family protein